MGRGERVFDWKKICRLAWLDGEVWPKEITHGQSKNSSSGSCKSARAREISDEDESTKTSIGNVEGLTLFGQDLARATHEFSNRKSRGRGGGGLPVHLPSYFCPTFSRGAQPNPA